MNSRQRFREVMAYGTPDRVPWLEEGLRDDVMERWQQQGMPAGGPAAVFTYDKRQRLDVDWSLRESGRKGIVTRDELPIWRKNLDRPITQRLAGDWAQKIQAWRTRDYLLELPLHSGLFLTMGVGPWQTFEQLMYLLADEPQVVHEAMELQGELARRVTQIIVADVELDMVSISEPIGGNSGPLVSPAMYRQFALAHYAPALRAAGHPTAIVFMTYANAHCLLPAVMEANFNCLWAMETESAAMDYRLLRKELGRDLRFIGGIDLDCLLAGEAAIEREMCEKVPALLSMGGCIPLADGRVRSSMSWERYSCYRRWLERLTSSC